MQIHFKNTTTTSRLQEGSLCIAFNNTEWSKTGDLPNGNNKYYQKAKIIKIRTNQKGTILADIIFLNGKKSRGHFLDSLTHY